VQYTNSWEAILQGAKPEYIGLDSNIRGLEIYFLGPQVSIMTPQNRKECRGEVGPEAAPKP